MFLFKGWLPLPMKMRIICGIVVILFLCNVSPLVARQTQEFFPLSEGNYWVYRGTVKWTESENKVKKSPITWKMQVIKRLKNGPYEIALMKGHPADLCWYGPGQKPGEYLIVWKDQKYYLIRINNDTEKLINDESYLSTKADFNSLFLIAPLKKDMVFGSDPDNQRTDQMYVWFVDNEHRSKLSHVAGISEKKVFTKYTLMYRTNPDHQIVEFVPSVGITNFLYVHHGTVAEADVRLVEFHQK